MNSFHQGIEAGMFVAGLLFVLALLALVGMAMFLVLEFAAHSFVVRRNKNA